MTLIEVLIAMAIFALISVMSVQAIGQLSSQGQIWQGRQQSQQEVFTAIRLLESDLQRAMGHYESPLPLDWLGHRNQESAEVFLIGDVQWVREAGLVTRLQGGSRIAFRMEVNRLSLQIVQQGQTRPLESLDLRLPVQAAEIVIETPQTSGGLRRLVALGSARL